MRNITGGQIRMDAMLLESSLVEAEGEMKPHLEKAVKALEQAQDAVGASMRATTDGIVSPGEIKLMHRVEDLVKKLQDVIEKGIDQREDTNRSR